MCTKALHRNLIRELCRLARVYECGNDGDMVDDLTVGILCLLDEICRGKKFEHCWNVESEGAC